MNTLETHVLELIGENTTSPDVFSDDATGMAPIRDSLNDAVEEIAMVTGSVRRKFYIPLESGMNFYRVSQTNGQVAWVTSAWVQGQKGALDQTDFIGLQAENPRWMFNSGTPRMYCHMGKDIICLWPAGDSDIVELDCVIIPERYTNDDDRVILRESFTWAAVHYAVSNYWASRGDAKSAQESFAAYLKLLGIQAMYPETYERQWAYKTDKK